MAITNISLQDGLERLLLSLLELLLDLGGPDDERAAHGVLHHLDAGVHVVDVEAFLPLAAVGGGHVPAAGAHAVRDVRDGRRRTDGARWAGQGPRGRGQ